MTITPDTLPYSPDHNFSLQLTSNFHEYNQLRTEQLASLNQLDNEFLSVTIPGTDKKNRRAWDTAQNHLAEQINERDLELEKLRTTLKSFGLSFTYDSNVDTEKSDKKALTVLGLQNNLENI